MRIQPPDTTEPRAPQRTPQNPGRIVDPELGRWTTQDPLRQLLEPVDANRYTYASNNPINLTDLSEANPCFWDGVSAVRSLTGAVFAAASVFFTRRRFNSACLARFGRRRRRGGERRRAAQMRPRHHRWARE